jgi:hypothetical protein
MYDDGSSSGPWVSSDPLAHLTRRKARDLQIKELNERITDVERDIAYASDFFLHVSAGDTIREFASLRDILTVNSPQYRSLTAAVGHIRKKLREDSELSSQQRRTMETALCAAEETLAMAEFKERRTKGDHPAAEPLLVASKCDERPSSFVAAKSAVLMSPPRSSDIDTPPAAEPVHPPQQGAETHESRPAHASGGAQPNDVASRASYRVIYRSSASPLPARHMSHDAPASPPQTPDAQQAPLFSSPVAGKESIVRMSSSIPVPTRHTSEAFVTSGRPSAIAVPGPVTLTPIKDGGVAPPLALRATDAVPGVIIPSRIEYRSVSTSPDGRRSGPQVSLIVPSVTAATAPVTHQSPPERMNCDKAADIAPVARGFVPISSVDSLLLSPSTPVAIVPGSATSLHQEFPQPKSPRGESPADSNAAQAGTSVRTDAYSRADSTAGSRTPVVTVASLSLQAADQCKPVEGTQQILLDELQRLTQVVSSLAGKIALFETTREEQEKRIADITELAKKQTLLGETLQQVSERTLQTEATLLRLQQLDTRGRESLTYSTQSAMAPAIGGDVHKFLQVSSQSSSRSHSPIILQPLPLPRRADPAVPSITIEAATPAQSSPFCDVTPPEALSLPRSVATQEETKGQPWQTAAGGSPARSVRSPSDSALVQSRDSSPPQQKQLPLVPPGPLKSSDTTAVASASLGASDAHLRRVNSARSDRQEDSGSMRLLSSDLGQAARAPRTAESIS